MAPSKQRLTSDYRVFIKVDQWLVVNFKLSPIERMSQIIFQLTPLLELDVEFSGEEAESTATTRLGRVHGYVRAAQQVGRVGAGFTCGSLPILLCPAHTLP